MTAIIDGKATAAAIKAEIAEKVAARKAAGLKVPHLAAILVGHDGGSETYVANKVKACEVCGFKSTLIRYEDDVTEDELLRAIDSLNADPDVDGFIVQLPLPKHISEQRIIEAIDYRKDVDGFHPINVGRMSIGLPCFVSATPAGIIELLRRYDVPTRGTNCVVLGRSNIVGKPVASLMMQKANPGNATVTVLHSASTDIKEYLYRHKYVVRPEEMPMDENTHIAYLGLPIRIADCLRYPGRVETVDDLIRCCSGNDQVFSLKDTRSIGKKSLETIRIRLTELGFLVIPQ